MKHSFKKSLSKENKFIQERKHLAVLKQLNIELESNHKVKFNSKTYNEYYCKSDIEKNKKGIDADCDIISSETGKIVKEAFAIDYKIRFKAYQPLDFLAEIISVDWNNTPGWAVDPNKETNGYVYIIEPIKKAIFVIRDELKNALDSGKFSDIKEKKAPNRGYNTISIPIRIDRLKKECPTTLIFNYE